MHWQSRRWLLVGLLGFATGSLCQASEGYVLDDYEVKSAAEATGLPIVIKDFTVDSTDFGKLKKDKQKETAAMMKRALASGPSGVTARV